MRVLKIIKDTAKLHKKLNAPDPRNESGVIWLQHELADVLCQEFTKQDKAYIYSVHESLYDAIIEPTLEDCRVAHQVANIILEDDAFGEEVHEYDKRCRSTTEPVQGTLKSVMAYRTIMEPGILFVRLIMDFNDGEYHLIQEVDENNYQQWNPECPFAFSFTV